MLQARLRKQLGSFVLDLAVQCRGPVTGLFGPSGCGKTTLLNCLAGVTPIDRGRIRIGQTTWLDTDGRVNVAARDRRVGYVFQDSLLFDHMSVLENVTYGRPNNGPSPPRRPISGPRLEEVVEVLEIADLLERMPAELSGGQRRRVAIARALLRNPDLLLLDEPLTGLDAELAGRVIVYLKRALDAFAIPALYVSHSISDVLYLCDEAVVLSGGRLVAQGRPRVVITRRGILNDRHLMELQNVFTVKLLAINQEDRSIRCALGDGELTIYGESPRGRRELTLAIHACDIVLALHRPEAISARNALRGTVRRIEPVGSKVLVFVEVGAARGGTPASHRLQWMVEVGRAAVAELDLRPGAECFAIVKATAIHILG